MNMRRVGAGFLMLVLTESARADEASAVMALEKVWAYFQRDGAKPDDTSKPVTGVNLSESQVYRRGAEEPEGSQVSHESEAPPDQSDGRWAEGVEGSQATP